MSSSDLEKQADIPVKIEEDDVISENGEQVIHTHDGINREKGILGKMWKVVLWADSFGVEVRGVERVNEDERFHTKVSDAGSMWFSANMTISTFSLGALGSSVFGLGLTDACLTIVFINLFTSLPAAMFSVWGKNTGLRQMILGRYSFGSIGIMIPIVLNCIACIGWSTINTIVGAEALKSVSDTHQLPTAAGIVIIAILTLGAALFGYKWVHKFERYASYPIFIIFIIMFGEAGRYITPGMNPGGSFEAADVLSFSSSIAGFALGWASLAADYTVNFPVDTPSWKVFAWTYAGMNFPMIFVELLGMCVMTTLPNKPTWQAKYDKYGLGGLLGAPLSPMNGFGKFLLVLLALSIVANNIPNMYSFALTFQAFGRYAQAIPRMFLVFLGTGIYIVLSIVGASHFESWLDTLLVILSYWLAIYSMVLIEEHYIFRKGSFTRGYVLEDYNTPSKLPIGFAAMLCTGIGIMGAVFGMAQTWYVGIIARKIGDPAYGGDIGFLLSGGFTAVCYPFLRYLELKFVGR